MILDVSHLNKNSFFDSLKYADRVIASHTGLSGTVEHIRNIDDEQLLAIKNKMADLWGFRSIRNL